jgi:hypothetical protein
MPNTEHNGYNNPRMDRLENLMDLLIGDHVKFADEHNKLLTSQVLLTGSMQDLQGLMKGQEGSIKELREAQKATDEQMKATDARLSILMGMMDNFIRERRDRQ